MELHTILAQGQGAPPFAMRLGGDQGTSTLSTQECTAAAKVKGVDIGMMMSALNESAKPDPLKCDV